MNSISQTVVETLNSLAELDPEAFAELVTIRITVNDATVAHPHIICSTTRGKNTMSILGLLNGILTASGQMKVAAVVDNDMIKSFVLLDGVKVRLVDAPPAETPNKP